MDVDRYVVHVEGEGLIEPGIYPVELVEQSLYITADGDVVIEQTVRIAEDKT